MYFQSPDPHCVAQVIEQREFAKRIGTTVEQILDDLCDAEYASAAL